MFFFNRTLKKRQRRALPFERNRDARNLVPSVSHLPAPLERGGGKMGGGWHPRGISLFKGARVKFSQPWAPSEFPISALPHYTSSPFPPDDRSRSQKPYPGGDLR